jgi:hypothetical protein
MVFAFLALGGCSEANDDAPNKNRFPLAFRAERNSAMDGCSAEPTMLQGQPRSSLRQRREPGAHFFQHARALWSVARLPDADPAKMRAKCTAHRGRGVRTVVGPVPQKEFKWPAVGQAS